MKKKKLLAVVHFEIRWQATYANDNDSDDGDVGDDGLSQFSFLHENIHITFSLLLQLCVNKHKHRIQLQQIRLIRWCKWTAKEKSIYFIAILHVMSNN